MSHTSSTVGSEGSRRRFSATERVVCRGRSDGRDGDRLVDPMGLNAIVLSFDEKSQIQALDRTQPSLPMMPGRAGTMTHDDKRNH